MTAGAFEEIEHTADWAIKVRGADLQELFVNAALGMASLMADVESVEPDRQRHVELDELDAESLLVSWLTELLWFNEETDAVFVRFEFDALTSTHLEATVCGGATSQQWRHIKAVTYHGLEIIETEDGYQVTLIFDV